MKLKFLQKYYIYHLAVVINNSIFWSETSFQSIRAIIRPWHTTTRATRRKAVPIYLIIYLMTDIGTSITKSGTTIDAVFSRYLDTIESRTNISYFSYLP